MNLTVALLITAIALNICVIFYVWLNNRPPKWVREEMRKPINAKETLQELINEGVLTIRK